MNLLPELVLRGHRVTVAVLWEPYTLAPALEAAGVRVHALDLPHRWALPLGTRRLQRVVEEGDFEIIHAHLFFSELYAGLLPARRHVRVATFHNEGYEADRHTSVWRRLRKDVHRRVSHCFDGHVAVSQPVAHHYARHLNLAMPLVIPNGVQVRHIRAMAKAADRVQTRAAYELDPSKPVVVVPGRLVKEKDHGTLLAALAYMGERAPTTLLVGDGPLRDLIAAEIASLELGKRVRMIPALPHEALFPLMAACDLLVSSSMSEGLGVALIEAAALGLPIVATDVGGVADVVEEGVTGWLVPARDPEALADAVRRVLTGATDASWLAEAAAKAALRRFDTSVVADQLVDYYHTLMPDLSWALTDALCADSPASS